MKTLIGERERLGLSQRELAQKAGIAFRTLQLLEWGRHDPRWSTLVKTAGALDMTAQELALSLEPRAGTPPDTAADVSSRTLEQGESSWSLHLFEFVDGFRRNPRSNLIVQAPDFRSSHRLQALLSSTVEFLCVEQGIPVPWWCAGVPPLPEPWFISETESLKASALVESPAQFRQRNIFVLGNFLERA